jgi:hypothetical protein
MSFNLMTAPMLGWWTTKENNPDAVTLDATGRVAFGIIPQSTSNITNVRIYVTGLTGTPAVTDLRCAIHQEGSDEPGTVITEVNAASIPAVGWINFTGLAVSATRGARLWVVLRNGGTANYCTVRTPHIQYSPIPDPQYLYPVARYVRSNDSGVTWAAGDYAAATTIRVGFADGTYLGFPLQDEFRADDTGTQRAQSAIEVGVRFTTPTVQLKVIGAMVRVAKTGTVAGSMRFRLYEGGSLIGTTDALAPALFAGSDSRPVSLMFPSVLTLAASTSHRLVVGATGSETSGNGYGLDWFLFDTDSNSLPLLPWQGSTQRTILNGTWTDTAGYFPSHALILDDPPFGSAGGTTSVKLYQQMGGMG